MRLAILVVALPVLLALPRIGAAKSETARIEISKGKHPFLTLSGGESAGRFTIWSGPGTSSAEAAGERDIADWNAGAVEPPRNLQVYKVRFYCAALGETPRETVPSSLCYGVRYGIDRDTGQGYIQVPPEHDREFPDNTRTIYRGVEGRWFRSSASWEERVRPQLDAALAPPARDPYPSERPYIYAPPSPAHTAVGARPSIPTRPK
jgi:hypothetical protein